MNNPLELTNISILHCTHTLQLLLNNSKKSYCTSVLQAIPVIYSCISISKCLSSTSSKYVISTWIKFRVGNNDIIKVRRGNTQYPTSPKIKAVKVQCSANYITAQRHKNSENAKSHNEAIH